MHRIMNNLKKAQRKLALSHSSNRTLSFQPRFSSKTSTFFKARKKLHAYYLPQLSYLKKIDSQYSRRNSRTILDFNNNFSVSLTLPVPTNFLKYNMYNIQKLLSISEPNILEHAARRVDLFFYTLVAYYNKHIIPEITSTKLQHGRGRGIFHHGSITQACHSSFTPSLLDTTILDYIPIQSSHDQNLKIKSNIISGTHFMDNLNSTIELPSIVNQFDNELENVYSCRKKSLNILTDVSMGIMNPIEGINNFLLMMVNTFKQIKNDPRFNKNIFNTPLLFSHSESIYLKNKLLNLIRHGTLINKWSLQTQSVYNEYIYMLLRLNPIEVQLCKNYPHKQYGFFTKKILSIQTEILNTPSAHLIDHKHSLR